MNFHSDAWWQEKEQSAEAYVKKIHLNIKTHSYLLTARMFKPLPRKVIQSSSMRIFKTRQNPEQPALAVNHQVHQPLLVLCRLWSWSKQRLDSLQRSLLTSAILSFCAKTPHLILPAINFLSVVRRWERGCGRDSCWEDRRSCHSQKSFAHTLLLLGTTSPPALHTCVHGCVQECAHSFPLPLALRNTQWKRHERVCLCVCVVFFQCSLSTRPGFSFSLLKVK